MARIILIIIILRVLLKNIFATWQDVALQVTVWQRDIAGSVPAYNALNSRVPGYSYTKEYYQTISKGRHFNLYHKSSLQQHLQHFP